MSDRFVLRGIKRSDGSRSSDPDAYDVLDEGLAVGRIYHTASGARGEGYSWFINGSSRSGFAGTLEEAREQWKKVYLTLTA